MTETETAAPWWCRTFGHHYSMRTLNRTTSTAWLEPHRSLAALVCGRCGDTPVIPGKCLERTQGIGGGWLTCHLQHGHQGAHASDGGTHWIEKSKEENPA